MRKVGPVELFNDELGARCTVCKKYIAFQRGTRPSLWKEILKAFVKRHRQCKGA